MLSTYAEVSAIWWSVYSNNNWFLNEILLSGVKTIVIIRKNVVRCITSRLQAWKQSLRILQSTDTIHLCVVGDSGYTKVGIFVVNAKKPNNLANLSLLGMYYGKHSLLHLRNCFLCLAPEINNFKNIALVMNNETKIFKINITAFIDMMFLCALFAISYHILCIFSCALHLMALKWL